jgi:hypothetical protein
MHPPIPFWKCRRSVIALSAIACITLLGVINKQDVSAPIASIVFAIAGANASQAVFSRKKTKPKAGQAQPKK